VQGLEVKNKNHPKALAAAIQIKYTLKTRLNWTMKLKAITYLLFSHSEGPKRHCQKRVYQSKANKVWK